MNLAITVWVGKKRLKVTAHPWIYYNEIARFAAAMERETLIPPDTFAKLLFYSLNSEKLA